MTDAAHALVDAEDRLIEADDRLAGINSRAGSQDGRLVLPAVLALVRLARRLNVTIGRPVRLADDTGDWEVWLRARPDEHQVRLTLAEWRERPVSQPLADLPESTGDHSPALLPVDFAEPLRRALDRPLSRIVATAETLCAADAAEVPQTYRDYARDIGDAGRHLQALLTDLAQLQQLDGELNIDCERIDLDEIGRRAVDLLSVRASDRGIEVVRSGGPARADGDFRRALQIAVNLLGNAVAFGPDESAIRIVTEATEGEARLTVADEGRGIAPDDQTRIFDKFVRVNPGGRPGSGLGLYISRRLARAMGGDLTVESAEGAGARFTLRLPVA